MRLLAFAVTTSIYTLVCADATECFECPVVLALYDSLPRCVQTCLDTVSESVLGDSNLSRHILVADDFQLHGVLQDFLLSQRLQTGPCIQTIAKVCKNVLSSDEISIDAEPSGSNAGAWSPYYNNTLSDFDWINIREGIKTVVFTALLGPALVRLAWHDTATCNIYNKSGGPHATMMLQDPSDPANRGLQRAIDALEPIYAAYEGKISRADLCRNDLTNIAQARLLSPDNDIPNAADDWQKMKTKFSWMGLNATDIGALILGGHGIGRCHTEYSGYHGPWTGQENTFSNFYITLRNASASTYNESLPDIHSWQRNSYSPVNGAQMLDLPSDLAVVVALTVGPAVDSIFRSFFDKAAFFSYWQDVFGRLLQVCLDDNKLGGLVSTEPSDPFGWIM
ncbi:hypothetical protein HDU82_004782 [Entophlyctis luteolus]|nr:hypothetical protein HDU82_004782 [Entophlyctis luteolus]